MITSTASNRSAESDSFARDCARDRTWTDSPSESFHAYGTNIVDGDFLNRAVARCLRENPVAS